MIKRNSLPQASDFIPGNKWKESDVSEVIEHFLGKSMDEAVEMLLHDFAYIYEDLCDMGPIAFCYYGEALRIYVLRECADYGKIYDTCLEILYLLQIRYDLQSIHSEEERQLCCSIIKICLEKLALLESKYDTMFLEIISPRKKGKIGNLIRRLIKIETVIFKQCKFK